MSAYSFQEAYGLHQQGYLEDAARIYRQILREHPKEVEVMDLLGQCCLQMGEADEALRLLKKCLKLRPGFALAHWHLGDALVALGDPKSGLVALRRAVAIEPSFVAVHCNIGFLLLGMGQPDEALASFARARSADPGFPPAWVGLGCAQLKLDRLAEAEESLRQALVLDPDSADAHSNLGLVAMKQGQGTEAKERFRRACALAPDDFTNWANLAEQVALDRVPDAGVLEEIEQHCLRALTQQPEAVLVRSTYITVLFGQGRYADLQPELERFLKEVPTDLRALSDLVWVMNYLAPADRRRAYALACEYGRLLSAGVPPCPAPWSADPAPQRLRVGLVSGDFRTHPVGFFLDAVLHQLDQERIELFAYPTVDGGDDMTERLRPCFSAWHPLFGLSDDQAAARIRDDGIHLLVDLSGYSKGQRLAVFARRPAPVQLSWLGYFATTGVKEIDYLLADRVGVPDAGCGDFSERLWYLPETRMCYSVPRFDVPVLPLPALSSPVLTFGCFQIFEKINDAVLAVWSRVLKDLPASRLRFHSKNAGEAKQVERLVQRFERVGIDRQRLEFHGTVPREDYLRAHGEVDMILDTFPFTGGTTTCDALWMGVPTLTLAGNSLLSRQGASLLSACGLTAWIVDDEDAFVAQALRFARDLDQLAALRAGLRAQVCASPLFDAPRFARHLADAWWGMWHEKTGAGSLSEEPLRQTR